VRFYTENGRFEVVAACSNFGHFAFLSPLSGA